MGLQRARALIPLLGALLLRCPAAGGGCREGANVLMAFTLFVFGIYSSYFVDYYRRFSYLRMRALAKHEKGTAAARHRAR